MLFLLILAAVVLVDIGLFIADKYWLSFVLFAATIAGSYFVFPEVPAFIESHSYWSLGGYYILGGVITAAVKWGFFNFGVASNLRDLRAAFEADYTPAPVTAADKSVVRVAGELVGLNLTKDEPLPVVPPTVAAVEKRKAFIDYLYAQGRYTKLMRIDDENMPERTRIKLDAEDALVQLLTPRAKNYVERITGWFVQWPVVVVTTIVEDLFLKIGRNLARLLDVVTRKLSAILIGGAVEGL